MPGLPWPTIYLFNRLFAAGYKVQAMEVPDNDALQYGREFGNRGQCNPTLFYGG